MNIVDTSPCIFLNAAVSVGLLEKKVTISLAILTVSETAFVFRASQTAKCETWAKHQTLIYLKI